MWTRKNNILKSILLGMCSITFIQTTNGQEKSSKNFGGVGFFTPGIHFTNTSGLNKSLSDYGIPGFSGTAYSFGGAGGGIMNNFYIGGEGHGMDFVPGKNNKYNTELSSGYGLLNVGYIIYAKKSFVLYPILGIGSGGNTLKIQSVTEPNDDFEEILSSNNTTLKSSYFMINAAINGDFFIGKGRSGLAIGWSLGYFFSLPKSHWEHQNNPVNNIETFQTDGFYFRIKIGGGSIVKSK